jgi:membrane protein YdbS with pleckstrin-like domain
MTPVPNPVAIPLPILPELRSVWRCVYVFAGSVVGLIAGGIAIWMGRELSVTFSMPSLCFMLPAAALAGCGWYYAGRRFSLYRAYLHPGQGVALQDGVWWRSEAWVPLSRLQYFDVNQGPLDRRWGMASISLQTASSHDHTTRIAGLPLQEAQALRAALLPLTRSEHE